MLRKMLSRWSLVRVAHAAQPEFAPETRKVLDEFLPMCAIPHQSGHEEALSRYLEGWAKKHGLAVLRDTANNVIIDKPAAPGYENAPLVILQAHIDMVCVGGQGYDPQRDPIETVIEGNTMKAKGTSLGADNGVGAAMALCVMADKSLKHGPLRTILTTAEEAGMDGAAALAAEHAKAKYLINIDGEDYDVLCNSCASCAHMEFTSPIHWTAPKGDKAFVFRVYGLQGGHSGVAIHEDRPSAVREVAYVLAAAFSKGLDIEVALLHGGIAGNAIPDSAEMRVVLPADQVAAFTQLVNTASEEFTQAYGGSEPGAVFALDSIPVPERVLEAVHARAVTRFLTVVPNGVRTMNRTYPGHTESSCSMGILRTHETELEIYLLARSSMPLHMTQLMLMGEGVAELCGFTRRPCEPSPGWVENSKSTLRPLFLTTFEEVTGQPMRVEPTHGGLECGWFDRKNPGMDMVAVGPHMVNPHSPEETLYLDTIPGMYNTILKVLEKLI